MKNQIKTVKLQFVFVILIVLSSIGATCAATITVTNTEGGFVEGSLRKAIFDAAPGDTINFDLPGCVSESPCAIPVFLAELVINKNLTIQGPGSNLLILSGNSSSRIFRVTNETTVNIAGLRILGGFGSSPGGGGILNSGGTLTISNCIIDRNHAGNSGGGILNGSGGVVTIINSTINDNSAFFNGGGIANNASGTMKIINSTIAANQANSIGGGISNLGALTITNSTIAGNFAGTQVSVTVAAGINAGGNETLANTIVAGNFLTFFFGFLPVDINGAIEAASHNLIGDAATSGGILHGVSGNIVGNKGIGTIDVILQTVINEDLSKV